MPDIDTEKDNSLTLEPLSFILPISARPERLDKVLAQLLPEHSRSRLQNWVADGHVLVNEQVVRTRHIVAPGDKIQVWVQVAPEDQAYEADDVAFEVLAESPDWLVVNKPVGVVTHPGAGNWRNTLLNGLLFRYPELRHVPRAGIVHRLDKDTSGLLVVARNEIAQTHFVRQLQERSMGRQYRALVHGCLSGAGQIDAAIGRDARVPVRMSCDHSIAPKTALTHYKVLQHGYSEQGQPVTEVMCRLETGRTHQIRVHMASIGHPLLGDVLYGGRISEQAPRQMLHAFELSFMDPSSQQICAFTASLAEDYLACQESVVWNQQSQ